MLCPGCGKEINPTMKFCEFCGVPISHASSDNAFSGNDQPVAQISYDTVNPYNNSYQNDNAGVYGVSQNDMYAGSMPQMQQPQYSQPDMNYQGYNGQQAYSNQPTYDSTANSGFQQSYSNPMNDINSCNQNQYSQTAAAVKKKSPKKFIIIAVSLLLAVAIGVLCFFFIRRKIERDYIVNNPTKSTLNSYKKYMEENNSDDPLYKLFLNTKDSGTLNVSAEIKAPVNGQDTSFNANAVYAYSKKEGRYYLKLDAGDLLKNSVIGSADNNDVNGIVEICESPQNLYFNYDLFGSNGKYYVDNTNFRQAINDSIFSPDKDNVLGISEADRENFDKFVDAYESAVKELSNPRVEDDAPTDLEATLDNLVKIAETNGNVTVEDGTAVVNNGTEDKSISADVITYSYNYESFKKMAEEFKDEIKAYLKKTIKEEDDLASSEKSIDESFDEFIKSYSEGAGENFTLVVKVYLDRKSHAMVKTTIDSANYNKNDADAKFSAVIDFLKAPDNMIHLNAAETKDGSENSSVDMLLKKTDDGTTVKYSFDMKNNTKSEAEPSSVNASFEYNRTSKQFTISANSSDEEQSFTYSGSADITDNGLSLTLDDVVKTDEMSLSLKMDFSSAPPPSVDISDAKDFLKLTSEEFENLFKGAENLIPGGSSQGLIVDDGGGNDFYNSAKNAASMADAATVNNALKTYYAGVVSGVINSRTNPEITGLPSPSATMSQRREAAKNATIEDAMKYSGLEDLLDDLYDFSVDDEGTVFSIYDDSYSGIIGSMIFKSTTLGEIYPSVG